MQLAEYFIKNMAMNQQDVFMIHVRELYAGKIGREPRRQNPSIPEESSMNLPGHSAPDLQDAIYVVDWQMEEMVSGELHQLSMWQGVSGTSAGNFEGESSQNSTSKETGTYIIDW